MSSETPSFFPDLPQVRNQKVDNDYLLTNESQKVLPEENISWAHTHRVPTVKEGKTSRESVWF